MGTKIKITKRQMKEDKFTTFMLRARDEFLGRWQVIAISAAIVIVAIVATVYFLNLQQSRQLEADNRLTKALAELRRANYQVAILELGSIADDYGGRAAGTALFNLANAHYESKNYDEAITNYQKFIDNYDLGKLMTVSAIGGIAACLENKQEFLAAGDKYHEAVQFDPDSPLAPDFYLGAIRSLVAAGDKDKAEQLLSELKDKFPDSEQARTATRLAMQLQTQ
ncbi:MAG: tetratricopeptide repeat protein [Candidatus Zixiibacteriota bacterium]|nr:MAG: tetratricopeptide repeat protein [candidate division Zixibacteria bacterium]